MVRAVKYVLEDFSKGLSSNVTIKPRPFAVCILCAMLEISR